MLNNNKIKEELVNKKSSPDQATVNFQEIINQFNYTFGEIKKNLKSVASIGKDIFENLSNYNSQLQEKLKEHSWIFDSSADLIEVFGDDELGKLILNEQSRQSDYDDFFVTYYTSNNFERLNKVLNSIEKNLSNYSNGKYRFKIINDAFKLFTADVENINPHNLIVPTLLTQIDHFREELKDKNGILSSNKDEIKIKEILDEKFIFKIITAPLEVIFINVFKHGDNIKNLIPDEDLYKTDKLYRHKILHGKSLEFGNIQNSLRCFLVLDILIMHIICDIESL